MPLKWINRGSELDLNVNTTCPLLLELLEAKHTNKPNGDSSPFCSGEQWKLVKGRVKWVVWDRFNCVIYVSGLGNRGCANWGWETDYFSNCEGNVEEFVAGGSTDHIEETDGSSLQDF